MYLITGAAWASGRVSDSVVELLRGKGEPVRVMVRRDDGRATWWEHGFHRLADYAEKRGDASPPQSYVDTDGYGLGVWVQKQRRAHAKGTLAEHLSVRLQNLPGWDSTPNETCWEDSFQRLQQYAIEKDMSAHPRRMKTPTATA